jgi:hypothetical protein
VIGGMPFDGMAIGGNLGRSHADMHRVLEWTVPALPERLPRHLLGIGDVAGHPRRGGPRRRHVRLRRAHAQRPHRHRAGPLDDDGAPRRGFRLNLKNAAFTRDERPLEAGCDCDTCRRFSRAYLRHLLKAGESLGPQLLTVHNLRFMERLMADVRARSRPGALEACVLEWLGHDPCSPPPCWAAPRHDAPGRQGVRSIRSTTLPSCVTNRTTPTPGTKNRSSSVEAPVLVSVRWRTCNALKRPTGVWMPRSPITSASSVIVKAPRSVVERQVAPTSSGAAGRRAAAGRT